MKLPAWHFLADAARLALTRMKINAYSPHLQNSVCYTALEIRKLALIVPPFLLVQKIKGWEQFYSDAQITSCYIRLKCARSIVAEMFCTHSVDVRYIAERLSLHSGFLSCPCACMWPVRKFELNCQPSWSVCAGRWCHGWNCHYLNYMFNSLSVVIFISIFCVNRNIQLLFLFAKLTNSSTEKDRVW